MKLEAKIHQLLSAVLPEMHRQYNYSDVVTYPYGVFKTDIEYIDRDTEAVYLDIDLFDRNETDKRLVETERKIRDALDAKLSLDEDLLLRVQFVRSTDVSTNDDNIKRRKISYYIKVNRR